MRGSGIRVLGCGCALAAMLSLGGCGFDQVDIQVPGGRMLGLTSDGKKSDAKDVPTRAPLVVPPNRSLPPPGARDVAAEEQAWPDDPEDRVKAAELERKRELEEYYQKGDWSGRGGIEEFEKLQDEGLRRPGVFGDGPIRQEHRESISPSR